ncbi:MAG TPA: hypothetical protein VIW68_10700 [Candidatus Sulfotelmatobacter sp.]
MPRAALQTLLVAAVLCASLHAQRGGTPFHGNVARPAAARPAVRSAWRHGSPNRVSSRNGFLPSRLRRSNSFGYFLPDDLFSYEQPDVEPPASGPVAQVMTPPVPEPALRQSQLIEIPSVANSPAAKVPPAAVFILATGERLEARRFILSASALSITVDRQQRTVPLEMLDLHATISANRDRGIDLRIPDDRNEISLSF